MIPATILSWAAPGALRTGCGLAHNPRRYEYLLAGGPGRSGRGYGPLSMRILQPAVDMFSLFLQVVGKNVSSSSSERASEKGVTQEDMSVATVTEISAISDTSFEDAIQQGIARATKTLRNVEGTWVKDQNVMIEDGNIKGYKVNLEVTFVLEE
jgi:dodecin